MAHSQAHAFLLAVAMPLALSLRRGWARRAGKCHSQNPGSSLASSSRPGVWLLLNEGEFRRQMDASSSDSLDLALAPGARCLFAWAPFFQSAKALAVNGATLISVDSEDERPGP